MNNQAAEQVFERVFKNSFKNLYAYAFNLLKEREAARDVVQQVFVKTWQTYTGRYEENHLLRYLYRAVYNTAINQLQVSKRRSDWQLASIDQQAQAPAPRPSENRELQKMISETFAALPDKCALVFHLNRHEGLKYGEIAQQLGISQKAVEKHMTHALKIFRVKLKDYLVLLLVWCINLLKLLS